MTSGDPWRESKQSREMDQPHMLPRATGIQEGLRVPIVRRPTRSLHRDEAVGRRERGSDWCRDKDESPRMHSMSSEERKKTERKALKLLAGGRCSTRTSVGSTLRPRTRKKRSDDRCTHHHEECFLMLMGPLLTVMMRTPMLG